ncbi:hypothetical protein [Streptomyces sp. NPDC012508]|uniref:hypothetical protein n=1 Tax=Streptomyces sp. NPDC012508 TaxID=3364837 RepID=UPI0036908C6F
MIDNGAADVVTALVATSGEGTGVVGLDASLFRVIADSSIFGSPALRGARTEPPLPERELLPLRRAG